MATENDNRDRQILLSVYGLPESVFNLFSNSWCFLLHPYSYIPDGGRFCQSLSNSWGMLQYFFKQVERFGDKPTNYESDAHVIRTSFAAAIENHEPDFWTLTETQAATLICETVLHILGEYPGIAKKLKVG